MGLEPTALGTTIRCSNQLSYNLHFESRCKVKKLLSKIFLRGEKKLRIGIDWKVELLRQGFLWPDDIFFNQIVHDSIILVTLHKNSV